MRASDDLRDKVLSRFLFETGAMNLGPDGELSNPTSLSLHVLQYDQQTGRVQAMIEHSDNGEEEAEFALAVVDEMCKAKLSAKDAIKWK